MSCVPVSPRKAVARVPLPALVARSWLRTAGLGIGVVSLATVSNAAPHRIAMRALEVNHEESVEGFEERSHT